MKIKFIFIGLAILLAIGGAFASKERKDVCEYYTQYRKLGSTYVEAGEYGSDFVCLNSSGVCTYYKPNPVVEVYLPCHTGAFTPIFPLKK